MSEEILTPENLRTDESPEDFTVYGLLPEQRSALSLELQLCLILADNVELQETPQLAPELTKTFASIVGISLDSLKDKDSEDRKRLQQATQQVKQWGWVTFEMIEAGKTKATLTPKGKHELDDEIARMGQDQAESNGSPD